MVRRTFKTVKIDTKVNNNKIPTSNDEVIVSNIIKEIPLNEPPAGKINFVQEICDDGSDFSEKVSNKMGEMILQGYSMLNECCPNCNNVLLANRRKEKGCVACAMRMMEEKDNFVKTEEKDRTERNNYVELEKTRTVREESEKIKGVVKVPEKSLSDRISAKMGDLLIKGHRMLDEYCPTCSCVLMEDPNTLDKSCIACQLSNPAPGKPIVVKEVKNEISLISNQGVDSKLVTTQNKGCIDFKNSQYIALQSVAARLQHTSTIVGDSTLPISPQDILINLEVIKECLNILKEFGSSA